VIGQTLGQYRLVEQIGKGGMATVYKAYQESMNRYVAIKILPHQFMHDETFLARFEREAQVIAQLEHRSILPVHDFGEQDGIPYIVMRYVDGGTVHDKIEQAGSLGLEQTTRIIRQVADALDFAHQRGIIHRDLKPRNILIDQQGDVYLSDFGIAKMLESAATLTGTGIMGTPAYIAPELAQGMKADKRVDVYALGVVTYEMLCGRVPYEADTPMGAIFKHVNEPVPSLCKAKADIPEVVDVVVQKALAKDPDERFQTAGELARALEAAYQAVKQGDTVAQQQLTATIAGTISAPMPGQQATVAPAAPPGMAVPEVPAAPGRVERKGGSNTLLFIGVGGVLLVCLAVAGIGLATGTLSGLFGASTPEVGEATLERGSIETPTAPGATLVPTSTGISTARPTSPPEPTASPTSVLEPILIHPYCEMDGESPVYVERGRPVTLVWTWTAAQANLIQDHIETASYEIYLDGERIEAERMGEIEYVSDKNWYTVSWFADVGVLSEGEHVAERRLSWSRQISDGWDTYGPGGEIETEAHTCTIIVQ
jgi:tRNA A-37 threonylcarbamoyl transferase component Bud32